MKVKGFFSIMAVAILLVIALAPMGEAVTSSIVYSQGSQSGTKIVDKGNVVGIEVSSIAVGKKLQSQELFIRGGPNSINKKLFNTHKQGRKEGNLIYEYGNTYWLDTSKYGAGQYTIEFIGKANNNEVDSSTLNLKIQTNQPQDQNAPSVNINKPTQKTYNNKVNEIKYVPTDPEGNLDKCWYSTDGGQTTSQKVNCNDGTSNMFSGVSPLNPGSNTWTVYAEDNAGNVGKSRVTFTYDPQTPDDQAPNVNVGFPKPKLYPTTDRNDLIDEIRYFPNDKQGNLDKCWYSLNGFTTNQRFSCQDGQKNVFSNLQNVKIGSNQLTVYAKDTNGNVGSEKVSFVMGLVDQPDDSGPKITPINPTDGDNLKDKSIKLTVSINESGTLEYSLNGGSKVTMSQVSSQLVFESGQIGLDAGKSHTVTYYATDNEGNTNTKTISFFIEETSQDNGNDTKGDDEKDDGSSGEGKGDEFTPGQGGSYSDDFTPGQGESYSYGKDKYLEQFRSTGNTIIKKDRDEEEGLFSDFDASWLLPILATLVGLVLIAIAIVLGLNAPDNRKPSNKGGPGYEYNQRKTPRFEGNYWY